MSRWKLSDPYDPQFGCAFFVLRIYNIYVQTSPNHLKDSFVIQWEKYFSSPSDMKACRNNIFLGINPLSNEVFSLGGEIFQFNSLRFLGKITKNNSQKAWVLGWFFGQAKLPIKLLLWSKRTCTAYLWCANVPEQWKWQVGQDVRVTSLNLCAVKML